MVSPGEVITPELYARCYRLCRDAIHRTAGHGDDLVLVGAVAPWNTQTIYPGNPNGDWCQYLHDVLGLLGVNNCDGFTLHAYTHGSEPALITSSLKLAPPFQNRHQHFRAYQDFMTAVPTDMRHLPVFLTEIGQAQPWDDGNNGWVQAAYAEIDAWNRQPGNQQIRGALLYRWPRLDKWYIDGKQGVEEDFQAALHNDFRWRGAEPPEEAPPPVVAVAAEPDTAAEPAAPAPAPAPPARSRRERRPAPERPYLVEWLDDKFPSRLLAGQSIVAQISVRNTGTISWPWGGGNPCRLGYRYYRNRRLLPMPPQKDLRTDIPLDVAPGESVVIEARIALPDEPGNYTLELDLVHEGVTWFKDKGSPVLTRWLTVETPAPGSQDGDVVHLPVRLFTDISGRLPRSDAPYARRNLNQIRYIVISHTGSHPRLGLDHVARAHIRRGYPGIAYDFVVDATGQILKVTELEDVAQPDQVWSEQGVNVCLTGNFGQTAPPLAQLDAAGRLCAWIAQNFGLTADAIVGLGELIRSDSPGETFYGGPRWKETLARQVRLHLAALGMGATEGGRLEELERQSAELRDRNAELLQQLELARQRDHELLVRRDQLQAELTSLRQQVEAQPKVVAGGLRLHDVSAQLPRDPRRYVPRDGEALQFIVVSHTGVAPETPLEHIAQAHRSEWPGILFDFVIDPRGEIYQTQLLDQVADSHEVYVRSAFNIAFAGDFGPGRIPAPDQLVAGGRLIAWLLERHPQLHLEAIRGLSEFIGGTSPGAEWNSGRTWKSMLLAAARRAGGNGGEDEAVVAALRSQVADLEHSLSQADGAFADAETQRLELVEENRRLQAVALERPALLPAIVVPKPAMRVIVDQLPKHPVLRYERRPLSQITHIAIHHTAAPPRLGPARIAELHIAADPGRGKEAWPGIGYHFFIHEDGVIDQTNQLETASHHLYRHYGYSVGVVFAGSFMNGKIPTQAQLRAGAHLVAWLMQELKAPLARVWGHREFPDNQTVCPGGEWTQGNRWRDLLFERIEQVQVGKGLKTIRHYLLFSERGETGAGEEFVNALGYIARFRPTVGFSPEEARGAEYVTIVGGEAGVSAAAEHLLVQAGCQVERLAGRDAGEVGRLLAELVRAGRRFRALDVDLP